LKPSLVPQFPGRRSGKEEPVSQGSKPARRYIVRMIKPKLQPFLTTGMFYLIVKDP
jgi:hypothetical protein